MIGLLPHPVATKREAVDQRKTTPIGFGAQAFEHNGDQCFRIPAPVRRKCCAVLLCSWCCHFPDPSHPE